MKYLSTLLTVLLAVAGLSASIDPLDVVIMSDPTSNTVIVRSAVPVSRPTTLELFDQRGNTLYNTKITEGDFFSKRFQAEYLPTGKYVLILTDERSRTTLPFQSNQGLVAFSPLDGLRTVFPRVDLQENRTLVVNYPAVSGQTLVVKLSGLDGNIVFTDSVSPESTIRKAYQLDNLSAGDYTLSVADRKHEIQSTAITLR